MYPLLLMLHNWVRWLVVLFGLYALLRAYRGFFGRRVWTPADRQAGMLFSISLDVQLLIGLLLTLVSPLMAAALGNMAGAMQSDELRGILVEHIPLMVVAVVFVHIGTLGARRAADDRRRFFRSVIWFSLTALVLLAAIPWWRPLLRLP
jgi:hypothetical protein